MVRLLALAAALTALADAPAPARGASGHPGRVVRVEAAPSHEVVVPGGTFTMGVAPEDVDGLLAECRLATAEADCTDTWKKQLDAIAARPVHVDTFAIDRREVSVHAYKACVEAGACALDPLVIGVPGYVADDLPMVEVTWSEARDYCRWHGQRLPTEAEWERAARGDDGRVWPWGDVPRPQDFNHGKAPDEVMADLDKLLVPPGQGAPSYPYGLADDSDGHAYAAPPGSYRWGAGPYGTLDQAGNVAEWVQDVWSEKGYAGLGADNPVRDVPDMAGPLHHVFRGGSWAQAAYLSRADVRDPYNPYYDDDARTPYLGFRCARSL